MHHHLLTNAHPVHKHLLAPNPDISPLLDFCVMSHGREHLSGQFRPAGLLLPPTSFLCTTSTLTLRAQSEAEMALALCSTAQQQLTCHCSKRAFPPKGQTNHHISHYKASQLHSHNKQDNQQHRNVLQKPAVSQHQHIHLECSSSFMAHSSYSTTCYLCPYAPTNAADSPLRPQREEGGPVPFFSCTLMAGTAVAGNRSA